jgi:hypothetical protein
MCPENLGDMRSGWNVINVSVVFYPINSHEINFM